MPSKKGSVLGAMLLLTGSCVGAGMLGLPIVTGLAGFWPALGMFLLVWAFMTTTALLLVEVQSWFKGHINLSSMVGKTLGKYAVYGGWVLFLLLFYTLLIAYIAGSGMLSASFLSNWGDFHFPLWAGGLFFVALFGWLVFLGTRSVDLFNRALMLAKIITYVGLVTLGFFALEPHLLMRTNPGKTLFALPILVISFGFHNMVPSVMSYMGGDPKRTKKAILAGSCLTLFIYILWEVIVLGIVPLSVLEQMFQEGKEASQAIASYMGSSGVAHFADALGFFALLTSFLAQSLSLVHFLSDAFNMKRGKRENIWACMIALGPPLILATYFPDLFITALNIAGAFFAVILFGVFPALMVYFGRRRGLQSPFRVWGGTPLLSMIVLFSLFIFFYQLYIMS